jgi:hypothetical protein
LAKKERKSFFRHLRETVVVAQELYRKANRIKRLRQRRNRETEKKRQHGRGSQSINTDTD